MKITIVGSGYVGLVAGACFAEVGNNVTMLDSDKEKIRSLESGIIPIYEPGLEELIKKNKKLEQILFTTDKKLAYENAEIIFIAVGTPMGEDGSADLSYVISAATDIAKYISGYTIIVNKSTVPVGSAKKVREIIEQNLINKNATFDCISNPEFLKEGVALKDFMSPDRVVLGGNSKKALDVMKGLYSSFILKNDRIITMSAESAEMTKYASNAMLATKISFINEISQICEKVGANINDVRLGIGSDSRIGYSFIYPGCGYGGSCFPKDIRALQKTAKNEGVEVKILNAIEEVNRYQKNILSLKIQKHFGLNLEDKTFCLWGLSFKPETDDIREATSINVITFLLQNKAKVNAYDPKAMPNMKRLFPQINYFENKYEAAKNANALVVITEWKEFRNPDFDRIGESVSVIFDGRNIYKDMDLSKFDYYFIGGEIKSK
ncbi:MAG: UDP-glucose/GDP-mannose dehydrogenase family protein [Helicobacteraceae bacterium]|nr:UDP-glucose/GDP-mannose dehydrogenase family protein [Helicobacteraceae bacterium]